MSMNKKHFEALAAALRAAKIEPIAGWENVHIQWKIDVLAVNDVCRVFNPRFDSTRFLKACGVEEGK